MGNKVLPHKSHLTSRPLTAPRRRDKTARLAGAAEPRTPLGRRLRAIRERIIASGEPLLDWRQLHEELDERRGAQAEAQQ